MPSTAIVSRCLELGVAGFDTSPYYGPSEDLLGSALSHAMSSSGSSVPRSALTLITKVGRVGPSAFDYSPSHVRYSVLRSLKRLNNTPYLDLVYAHDVEFVSATEVLAAVRELRRLRDDGLVRYVGISGFPVDRLVELAEMIKRETAEGVDAVLSYGNFTIQNRTLGRAELGGDEQVLEGRSLLQRFKDAGVDVVLNASMLGMGLLTTTGIPPDPETPVARDGKAKETSPLAKWHPSPPPLRAACKKLAALAAASEERLESVAIRWSLAEWARIGALAGLGVNAPVAKGSVGATVMGVTSVVELEETLSEWTGVLDSLSVVRSSITGDAQAAAQSSSRQAKILELVANKMWPTLGKQWLDYSWASPGSDFVNELKGERTGRRPGR